MCSTPSSAAVRPTALARVEIGISARQDNSRSVLAERPRSMIGVVINSTTQPTSVTGTATGAKENIDTPTPNGAAKRGRISAE